MSIKKFIVQFLPIILVFTAIMFRTLIAASEVEKLSLIFWIVQAALYFLFGALTCYLAYKIAYGPKKNTCKTIVTAFLGFVVVEAYFFINIYIIIHYLGVSFI